MIHREGVDIDGVDVLYCPGSNEWSRLVLRSLDGWKVTVQQGLHSEMLGRVGLIHLHGLAFGKKRKKVGEKDVEEFQWLCLLEEWDADAPGAINEQYILWKKTKIVYTRIYQVILVCNMTY
jgi:hypothetical protein